MEENKKVETVDTNMVAVPEEMLGRLIRGNNMNYYRKGFMDGYFTFALGAGLGCLAIASVYGVEKAVRYLKTRRSNIVIVKEETNGDKDVQQ